MKMGLFMGSKKSGKPLKSIVFMPYRTQNFSWTGGQNGQVFPIYPYACVVITYPFLLQGFRIYIEILSCPRILSQSNPAIDPLSPVEGLFFPVIGAFPAVDLSHKGGNQIAVG